MSIKEYKAIASYHIQEDLQTYLKKKYKSLVYIFCWFDLFIVDVRKRNMLSVRPEKIEIERKDYAELLAVMLKYPDLTFEDLPIYINE